MDQELVPDQDMPSDDSFEQAVRDEGDVADTAATEIKTARSKESKKTGGENMEALVEGGRSVPYSLCAELTLFSFSKSPSRLINFIYQLAQQIDIKNQKHSAQLEEQNRIFERQLQKRDEQLDKILKGMERNVNPEQIPRYEIYCNVRQGFVIHNFSGPLKLKRPWVTLSTTRTSAIPGMK